MYGAVWLVNYAPILRLAGLGMAVATGLLIGAVACWYELSRAGGVALLMLSVLAMGSTTTLTVLMVIETHTNGGTRPQTQPNFMHFVRSAKAHHRRSDVQHWQP